MLWPTCQLLLNHVCYLTMSPRRKEKTPRLLTSFYSFTLVYFLSIEFCVQKLSLPQSPARLHRFKLHLATDSETILQPTPNHWLPKTSLQGPLNCQPISNLGKPPFCNNYKGESLNTKATQASNSRFLLSWKHLIVFSIYFGF